jgi:hypothetical protein
MADDYSYKFVCIYFYLPFSYFFRDPQYKAVGGKNGCAYHYQCRNEARAGIAHNYEYDDCPENYAKHRICVFIIYLPVNVGSVFECLSEASENV